LSAFVFANVIALTVSTAAGAATAVRVGSASISTDPESATWTIASSGAALTLVIDPARDFEVVRLSSPRKIWATGGQTDTVVKIGSQTIGFGNRAAGFRYADVTASVHGSTVQLDVVFDLSTSRLRVTRNVDDVRAAGHDGFDRGPECVSLDGVSRYGSLGDRTAGGIPAGLQSA
jgi:hypothetical protein